MCRARRDVRGAPLGAAGCTEVPVAGRGSVARASKNRGCSALFPIRENPRRLFPIINGLGVFRGLINNAAAMRSEWHGVVLQTALLGTITTDCLRIIPLPATV